MRLVLLSLAALAASAAAALSPRASPVPCTQPYVCPEPAPYPGYEVTGQLPGPDEFKCRIGWSSSDPDFAFCFYSKNTGELRRSTPVGIEGICWAAGMPNPQCAPGRKRAAVPRRLPAAVRDDGDVPAPHVSIGRFFPRRLAPEARNEVQPQL